MKGGYVRPRLLELHATNKSTLAEQALRYIELLYEIEREAREWYRSYDAKCCKKKPCQ